ncbi:MAG: long-chain fatty acid--CoA ligase [Calditrichaceae bacterium]|nr:long-chain fatty acid--CoA ligase [Calditrichaceae bacterium]MBN2708892.1 long-chain fatty acid--CoA ligase [Calditrichaceae bacterium]RQV97583.1 MAG: long-chain fatty acid--CoA ligase [Calditrichota bacterium]
MFKSIVHLLFNTIDQYGKKDALRYREGDKVVSISYEELGERVINLTHGMSVLGIKEGDKIAILSNNRPEWPITDFASFALKALVIPIYQTLPPNQIEYILNDAQVRAVFVENELQLKKIEEIKKNISTLEFIVIFDSPKTKKKGVETFSSLIVNGEKHRKEHKDFFKKSIDKIKSEEICTIVYTSGTTGNPKGVMLHHKGFVQDIINAEAVLNIYPDDVFLSFLPLSHLYERLAGHWTPIYRGATIYYARSIDTVIEDIAEARPTIMVSVPRLYEKVASAVQDQVEHGPAVKRNLFYWAIGTGLEYHEKRIEGTAGKWLEKRYQFADKVVFSKIKKKLGGRFRCPIAGGAPLSVDTLKFFEAIGLRIVEGYGMTETHLIITLTPPGKTKYGSCGKPIGGLELRIAEDGEVLIKGDILMAGYYNQPEITAETIDKDGWLHTGDIGYLDEDNYLFLTDRKKNIIVTSGGKNVAPAPIEHKLKTSKYIDEVCLVGNQRKFISALIIPNYELLKKWAKENNLKLESNEELVKSKEVLDFMMNEVNNMQEEFARYEAVKKITLLPVPFSIDEGEITPSLKIKRNVVEKKYKTLIDRMYVV